MQEPEAHARQAVTVGERPAGTQDAQRLGEQLVLSGLVTPGLPPAERARAEAVLFDQVHPLDAGALPLPMPMPTDPRALRVAEALGAPRVDRTRAPVKKSRVYG